MNEETRPDVFKKQKGYDPCPWEHAWERERKHLSFFFNIKRLVAVCGGGVRQMRTRLYKSREAAPYATQSARHSARTAARLAFKLPLL